MLIKAYELGFNARIRNQFPIRTPVASFFNWKRRPRSKLVKQVQLSHKPVSSGFQKFVKKTFKANVTNYQ